jgi:hypothetical protein
MVAYSTVKHIVNQTKSRRDGEKPTRWEGIAVHHQGYMGDQTFLIKNISRKMLAETSRIVEFLVGLSQMFRV